MSTETLTSLREVTLTPDESAAIQRAHGILARVRADGFLWPWSADKRTSILMAIDGLEDSLDEHRGLRHGTVHPESVFFDLAAGHPDGALAEALERVAEDIRDWTAALASLADEATVLANSTEGGTR